MALNIPKCKWVWVNSIREYSKKQLLGYNLVILAKSNDLSENEKYGWMNEETENTIREYIRTGHGFLAIHSGIAEYDGNYIFRSLLGGIFDHHPEQCLVTINPIKDNQLTTSVHSFTVLDEHYFVTVDDPTIDIFLTASSEHGQQPAGWRRHEGNGRVGVIAPGHNLEVWIHPSYQTLLRNIINWCIGIE